jgi:hypothetical protein
MGSHIRVRFASWRFVWGDVAVSTGSFSSPKHISKVITGRKLPAQYDKHFYLDF